MEAKRFLPIEQDIYNEKGTYQTSFYMLGDTLYCLSPNEMNIIENNISWHDDFSNDYEILYKDYLSLSDINLYYSKYISILSNNSSNEFTIYKASSKTKNIFINTITILLYKTSKLNIIPENYYQLLEVFFASLPLLGYDPSIKNLDLNQDLIGLVRSDYYFHRNYLIALSLKKEN